MTQSCLLIVASDVLIRSPLAEYLRECGYRVLEAATATEARQLLEKGPHQIEAVLADADASGDAFALGAWIRDAYPQVKVVMAGSTAKATEKAGDLCDEGPQLSKPYDPQVVLDQIRHLLAARDRAADTN